MVQKQAPKSEARLEAQLQSKLQVTSIQSAGSRSERAVGDFVVSSTACGCQEEVCPVEYVESLSVKLQVDPFGELEDLAQGHISRKEAGSFKRVPAKISGASQARRREC